jgi:hypothetical protein
MAPNIAAEADEARSDGVQALGAGQAVCTIGSTSTPCLAFIVSSSLPARPDGAGDREPSSAPIARLTLFDESDTPRRSRAVAAGETVLGLWLGYTGIR